MSPVSGKSLGLGGKEVPLPFALRVSLASGCLPPPEPQSLSSFIKWEQWPLS